MTPHGSRAGSRPPPSPTRTSSATVTCAAPRGGEGSALGSEEGKSAELGGRGGGLEGGGLEGGGQEGGGVG